MLVRNQLKKAAKRLTTLKPKIANVLVSPEEITKKINDAVAKYVDTSAIKLNKLIDESSANRPNASNAIQFKISKDG